jgi:hypothetical protein
MRVSDPRPRPDLPSGPDPVLVEDLIRLAEAHPLGLEYLREGLPDSIAATFGVHAFVVDAARERLGVTAPAQRS